MTLFLNRTPVQGSEVQGVSPQESFESIVASAPDAVNSIRALLLADTANTPECRIAWPLMAGNIRGIRPLEVASGIGDKQVWEITSSMAGGLSPLGLVRTIERGTSWTSEGREKGEYALADTDRENVTKGSLYKNPPTPLGEETLKGLLKTESLRDVFPIGIVLQVLNPSLDLWRRSKNELGSEGWRIAVITLLAPVTMTMAQWAELLQVTPANARKLAAKFEAKDIATRTKEGRTVRITLDWSIQVQVMQSLPGDDLLGRARNLMNEHAQEQLRIQRPPSGEELEIRRRIRHTALWAKPYFDAALEEGVSPELKAELERIGHMYASAKESDWRRWMDAGRPLSEAEVAELAPKVPEPTPEEQEATRARLAALRAKVLLEPKSEPVVQEVREETEDDRLLRTMCNNNPRIFESLYGRLPNREAVVDARTQARIDKARRRRARAVRA